MSIAASEHGPALAKNSDLKPTTVFQAQSSVGDDAVLRHLALGDRVRAGEGLKEDPAQACTEYAAALNAVTPTTAPSLRLRVEQKYLNALIKATTLNPAERQLSLDVLLKHLEAPDASPQERRLIEVDQKVRGQNLYDRLSLAMAAGMSSEITGQWEFAAAAYKSVAAASAGAEPTAGDTALHPWLGSYVQEAARSASLMNSIAAQDAFDQNAPASHGPAFLGVDHTIGSNWSGTLGTEGWVLFAPHGDDLCGGPRVLDHTFSYRAYLGDSKNVARRWRDPAGPLRFPGSDLPLDDPAVPGESVISYLDDNGEEYPVGAGPDLYVDLAIPPGEHILSMPLHFDLKTPEARYGFYLLASSAEGAPKDNAVHCLAEKIVSTHDEPGYVRLLISGPARYSLLIRRLTSENANLPALFLDADPRAGAKPLPIDDFLPKDLPPDELAAAGLLPPDEPVPAVPYGTVTAILWQLVADYRTQASAPAAMPQDPAVERRWTALMLRARSLMQDGGLTATQQGLAAWVLWHSSEQLMPNCGRVKAAFADYLKTRYSLEPAGRAEAQPQQLRSLRSLASRLRTRGQVALAEQADTRAWTLLTSNTLAGKLELTSGAHAGKPDFPALWREEAAPYLIPRTVWLWEGTDNKPPKPLLLPLDVEYAAKQAGEVTKAILLQNSQPANNLQNAQPASDPLAAFDAPQSREARAWVDDLARAWKVSLNGTSAIDQAVIPRKEGAAARSGDQDAPLVQPAGLLLYAEACLPLLGGIEDEKALPNKEASCLLRADQLEQLARALLDKDLFVDNPLPTQATLAKRVLLQLQAQYPSYPRMDQVGRLLEGLAAAPKG